MMVEDVDVEQLESSDKPELVELFTQAFKEHPLFPALGANLEATRPGMKAFIDCFGGAEKSALYGIRQDNKLICASLCLDAAVEPPKPALVRFILFLYRTMGWRIVKEFEVINKEEPKYKEPYLEIVILGTLPSYQKRGFGRKMLHFLYDEASREEYKGLTLLADRNTPAFQLYLKEGFVVDKEFTLGEATLCWMRLTF